MESISVFEIIKVGIGPSSSHTMGPWNAASSFLNLIKREHQISEVKEVFVEFFWFFGKNRNWARNRYRRNARTFRRKF